MIIPKPVTQNSSPGSFSLNSQTQVFVSGDDKHVRWVGEQLARRLGVGRQVCKLLGDVDHAPAPRGSIVIVIDPSDESLGAEGYRVTVERDMVTLCASGGTGAFYAAESLIQLAPRKTDSCSGNGRERRIACVQIEDQPRFPWRGMMLDSARHYQDIPTIKAWIDRIASLKLNRFHWHLTDDEAWRIQIDKYPRLTENAAWRGEGENRYGGFYTKDQAREVVAYAKDRGITVIPEIEMPGHCNAALYAYPHLSCSGKPLKVGKEGWNAYTQVEGRLPFCVGRDETLTFIKDVLREVAEVFDTPYIHVGGDERPAEKWSECPHCNERMKQAGLANEDELHVWFMSHIANFVLQGLGRQSIGWAEKLELGMAEGQIIQGWHAGQSSSAIAAGRQTINSTHEWVYMDYPWSVAGQKTKSKWMPILPLRKVYEFDPAGEGDGSENAGQILGSEAPVWTEFLSTQEQLEQHLMPRLVALSETLWSPRNSKNFKDFQRRLLRYQDKPLPAAGQVVISDLTKHPSLAINKGKRSIRFDIRPALVYLNSELSYFLAVPTTPRCKED
jgi:hexosaminidase